MQIILSHIAVNIVIYLSYTHNQETIILNESLIMTLEAVLLQLNLLEMITLIFLAKISKNKFLRGAVAKNRTMLKIDYFKYVFFSERAAFKMNFTIIGHLLRNYLC